MKVSYVINRNSVGHVGLKERLEVNFFYNLVRKCYSVITLTEKVAYGMQEFHNMKFKRIKYCM